MALDPRISDSVRAAAAEMEQDTSLAGRLIAWLEALSDGNENFDRDDSVVRRVELLYSATVVDLLDETEDA